MRSILRTVQVLSWLPGWHRYRNPMAGYVGQVKYSHGYLSGARRVLYCHSSLFGTDTEIPWLVMWGRYSSVLMASCLGHVEYCTVIAACLAQIQKCHGWLCRTGTVQYCHAACVVQVQCCKATCLGHVKYCHGCLCGAGTEMSRLPLSGAGTVLS
jgi:hypothetical protein